MNRMKDRFMLFQLFRVAIVVGPEAVSNFSDLVVTIKKCVLEGEQMNCLSIGVKHDATVS